MVNREFGGTGLSGDTLDGEITEADFLYEF
jgi:hypothetical protein